jgi:hypothetical protein
MAGKTISQKITLEGGDEIRKALEQLAQAATDSAAKIQQASEAGASGFTDTGKAATTAAEGLAAAGEAGDQAAGGIGNAAEASTTAAEGLRQTAASADEASKSYSNLSLESAETAAKLIKLGLEIAKVGAEIGLAVTRHESLTKALVKLAFQANSTTKALGILAEIIGPTAVGLTVAGTAVAAAAVGLTILEKTATAAAKGYEELNHQLQTLAQTSAGTSFESLQKGSAALEQIGIKSETARSAVIKLDETLKDFDAGDKIKASTQAALEAEKALIEARLSAGQAGDPEGQWRAAQRIAEIKRQLTTETNSQAAAEETVKKAAEASATAQANKLSTVIPLIKQIQEGQKGIKFDEATTAATKIAAFNARLKEVKDTTGDARQEFLKIIANAPTLKDALAFGATVGFSETDVDRVRRFGGEATKIPDLFQRISQTGALIGPAASKSFDDMTTSIQDVENAKIRLDQAMQTSAVARLGAIFSKALDDVEAAFITLAARLVEGFNTIVGQIGSGFVQLGTWAGQSITGIGLFLERLVTEGGKLISDWVTTPIANAWQWLVDTFTGMIQGGFSSALATGRQLITDFVTTPVANAWQWIVDAWKAMVAKLGFGGGSGTPVPAGGEGHAAGGLLGGRGSGTSDSNLAWVSRGEYIVPARAVAQPGVLAFLETLRRGMGHFALGGMVGPVGIPAFAGGGMNAVTINFPGLPEITGLRASSGVVEQLRKAAAMAQVRSGGRKPSRFS